MRVVGVDRYLQLMVKNYVKYFINYHAPLDILFNAWTLMEKNFITINEICLSVELLEPPSIVLYLAEQGTQVEVSKLNFIRSLTKQEDSEAERSKIWGY
jgi:hypothetical protein